MSNFKLAVRAFSAWRAVFLGVLAVCASGCNDGDTGPAVPSPTATARATATVRATATARPTATASAPAVISTPLPTQPGPAPPGVVYSPVRIRALQSRASVGQVRVFFTGPLDPAVSATSGSFIVTFNQVSSNAPPRLRSYDPATQSVLIQFPVSGRFFQAGDLVSVAIFDVRDAQGRFLPDQQTASVAALS